MNWKTKGFVPFSLLASSLLTAGLQAGRPILAAEEHPVERIAQELLDAIAPGDKAVWERHLDDSCVVTDEEGNRISKAELLPQLTGLPPGRPAGGRALRFWA